MKSKMTTSRGRWWESGRTMPDPIDTAYQRALAAARERSFQLTRQGVDRLYRALAEVLNRLTADEESGIINAARAEQLRQEVDALLRGFRREMVRTGEETIGQTLIDVVEIHRRISRELFRRYGPAGLDSAAILQAFDRLPARALAAMVSRPNAATFRTLVNRRIQGLTSEIDTFLDAAVARGVSAGRASKDLASIMARDDIRLRMQLTNVARSDLQVGASVAVDYGLDDAETKALRGLLYDARRIVVTETNSAHREANAQAMTESPVVVAAQWQLSGRHFKTDACDVLAETDAYGYGPGFYPPDAWPVHPHPHCGCYAGRTKFRRPSEWAQPKPASNPLGVDPRDDGITARFASDWTDNERARQQAAFAQAVAIGERSRRRAA